MTVFGPFYNLDVAAVSNNIFFHDHWAAHFGPI